MGQIVSGAAKPKRCNIQSLSQLGTPAAGEYILVSSDNSMNAAGQGNFDCYIVGVGTTVATALELKPLADVTPTSGSKNSVTSDGVYKELYTEKKADLSLGNNYISEKYINPAGNLIAGGAYFHVYYFPCKKGDKFNIKATINSSSARLYAIYNTADTGSFGASTLLSIGPVCNTTEEENVIITQDNAQMIAVQYYRTGTLSVHKIEYGSKFFEELIVGKEWIISEVTGYDDNEMPIQYNIVWADGTAGTVILSNFDDDVLEYQTITATYLNKTIVYNIVFDANGYIINETYNVNSNN